MKIIELLNKIANNEEVPKKIKVSCYEFEWREEGRYYANTTKGKFQSLVQDWLNNSNKLNSKVEIIEDEEEPKMFEQEWFNSNEGIMNIVEVDLAVKINELIKAVKQLDKKSEQY